jgi:hypothetical protein
MSLLPSTVIQENAKVRRLVVTMTILARSAKGLWGGLLYVHIFVVVCTSVRVISYASLIFTYYMLRYTADIEYI